MKTAVLLTVGSIAFLVGCQKHTSDEEQRAEIERQVQQRLAAEHQQQQAQELGAREADLNARERALKDKENVQPPERSEPDRAQSAAAPQSTYSTFYTRLEPYGDWIETEDYGYVFRPRDATSTQWRPYTDGRWVYTDAGWMWISEEAFGWATYHYGRWTRIRGVGWVWVPGTEWAPAWVSWRKGNQYVGWAPLPPEAEFDAGTGIRNWADSYYDLGPDQYVFVPEENFGDPRVRRVVVPEQQNVTIVNETTNVTNISYNNTVIVNQGPSFDELRSRSREQIPRLRLERHASIQREDPRAVVRGDVVEIPAPQIIQRTADRPPQVKERISAAQVDLGWAGVGNAGDAQQLRNKMKSEASPPQNPPPKRPAGSNRRGNAAQVRNRPGAIPPTGSPTRIQPQTSTLPQATAAPAEIPATSAPVNQPFPSTRTASPGTSAVSRSTPVPNINSPSGTPADQVGLPPVKSSSRATGQPITPGRPSAYPTNTLPANVSSPSGSRPVTTAAPPNNSPSPSGRDASATSGSSGEIQQHDRRRQGQRSPAAPVSATPAFGASPLMSTSTPTLTTTPIAQPSPAEQRRGEADSPNRARERKHGGQSLPVAPGQPTPSPAAESPAG